MHSKPHWNYTFIPEQQNHHHHIQPQIPEQWAINAAKKKGDVVTCKSLRLSPNFVSCEMFTLKLLRQTDWSTTCSPMFSNMAKAATL